MSEIKKLKKRILEEIRENGWSSESDLKFYFNPQFSGIKIYSLPDVDSDEDEEYKLQVRSWPDLRGWNIIFFLALGGSTEGEYSVRSLRS